jgi:hypothetical protein
MEEANNTFTAEELENIMADSKDKDTVKPWDIVNPSTEWAEKSLSNERYNICLACPELIKLTRQCKKCGCFMAVKTKLQEAKCPLGKW